MKRASCRAENRKTGSAKIRIVINCYYAAIFGALYYGVYHKSGLPSIGTLLTADNQQPSVQTACLVYVSEKLSTLTASYTFSSAGV